MSDTIGTSTRAGVGSPGETYGWKAPCPRAGRLFGGCKFAPRFEDAPFTAEDQAQLSRTREYASFRILAQSLARKTYVRDVCERCGKTIERERGEAK